MRFRGAARWLCIFGFWGVSLEALIAQGELVGPQEQLTLAISGGDVEGVRSAIKRGANPRQTDTNNGRVPLVSAAVRGYPDIVGVLLLAGAPKDGKDPSENGSTALNAAAKYGRTQIVEELLAAGARTDVRDDNGYSPLGSAALYHHSDIARQLIAHHASVNEPGDKSPLRTAALFGYSDMAELLVMTGKADTSVLPKSIPVRPVRVLKPINRELVRLIPFGQLDEVLELLYRGGADLNGISGAGDQNADPNGVDEDGTPVLTLAARWGQREVVNALIKAGAAPNPKRGENPLIWAVSTGRLDIVSDLLQAGADINFRPKDGKTPIIAAALNGQLGIVRLLLAHRADASLRDYEYHATAAEWAHTVGRDDITHLVNAAAK
jgi:ankyrin repeat protein